MIKNFVVDFDGTIADTLTESPNGIGVNEGYKHAIRLIFGNEGLTAYENIGGLKNRAPTELIKELLKEDKDSLLFSRARAFFYKKRELFENLVPKEKGFLLEWPIKAISLDKITLHTISEMIVRVKLSFLMKEIGTMQKNGKTWPEPCRGFIDFFKFIQEMNEKKEDTFQIAILSSGHELFIKKVLISWGISSLPNMLTDDDLRNSNLKEIIAKPSAALFDILEKKINKNERRGNGRLNTKNTIYIGDDPEKDGKLAKNAGIPFMLFCGNGDNFGDNYQSFDNWIKIITILKEQQTSG